MLFGGVVRREVSLLLEVGLGWKLLARFWFDTRFRQLVLRVFWDSHTQLASRDGS